jgi:nitronate monooxygenase
MTACSYKVGTIELQFILGAILVKPGLSVPGMQALAEAKAAEAAGAETIIAQGMEARGHRGAFDATKAEQQVVGLFALVAAIVDAVQIPVMATGGIAGWRGVAAAMILAASAVMMGTAFRRCPETRVHSAWAN